MVDEVASNNKDQEGDKVGHEVSRWGNFFGLRMYHVHRLLICSDNDKCYCLFQLKTPHVQVKKIYTSNDNKIHVFIAMHIFSIQQ